MTATKKLPIRVDRIAETPSVSRTQAPDAIPNERIDTQEMISAFSGLVPDGGAILLTLKSDESIATSHEAKGNFHGLEGRTLEGLTDLIRPLQKTSSRNLPLIIFDLDENHRCELELPVGTRGTIAIANLGLEVRTNASTFIVLLQSASRGPFHSSQIASLQAMANILRSRWSDADFQAAKTDFEQLSLHDESLSKYYVALSSAIRQCFWVLDTELSRVDMVSDNFEKVWGSGREAILSGGLNGFMDAVFPEDRDRVLSDFHTGLASGNLDLEFRVIDLSGELKWIWLRGCRVANDQKIVLIADDVTDHKVEQERIRTQEAELVSRARAQAVVDLASGVAHEINNPLTIIVGNASLLNRIASASSLPDAGQLAQLAQKIQTTSMRISEIVKSLKSLARERRPESFVPTNLGLVYREVRDMCTERFKNGGVDLVIEEPSSELASEMNPTLIGQLAINLVNNAFDAVQSHEKKWVKVGFQEDHDSVYISVTDSGSGIPIKIRGRIFDPFFTTKEPGKGTGLGLSLALQIAAHHNGSLRLDTLCPNTRFVLQIPKKQKR